MTLGVDPESKEEVEVGPPGLIAVVEETLDGTNWNEIGRLPPSRPTLRQRLITDVTARPSSWVARSPRRSVSDGSSEASTLRM